MAIPPSVDEIQKPSSFPRLLGIRRKYIYTFLRLGLSVGLALFITQLKLDFFEFWLYDLRIRSTPAPVVSGESILIFVDQKTVENLKRLPTAQDYSALLKQLKKYQPRASVFDLDVEDIKGSDIERKNLAQIGELVPDLYVLTNNLEVKGEEGAHQLSPPFQKWVLFPGPKSADISQFAQDGVTRRMLIRYQGQEMLHVHLARQIDSGFSIENIPSLFELKGTDQGFIRFRPTGSYPRYSFLDILNGNIEENVLRNKVIFIGHDLQISKLVSIPNEGRRVEREYLTTPFSRDVLAMTTVEMHANILDTLLQKNSPYRPPAWVNFLFVLVVCMITVYVVFTLKPLIGLVVLAGTLFLTSVIGFLCFWPFSIWIDLAHPFVGVFLCYYFFIPYRLIMENRRSWEIYQKHKLLQQVETLKSNFISMMSHDLKTPIARIQGMVDIVLRGNTPLSPAQHEAVDSIKQSSEDLLKFINSILSYGKIESEGIQIQKKSKDINVLLTEVVKKHEFLAKLKKIHFVLELEPLFPIAVDPELMKQVFSNLIENAIKYSPEDTKILISSEEKDSAIEIQVADQGPGIAPEDLPHLFMKFFRTQKAKSSSIKGSGLGLYLAKYFTELHGGNIFVESTYGQGSTFTIRIPIQARPS